MKADKLFRLHDEFLERFTLKGVGCPETLDGSDPASADNLWWWIIENFVESKHESD